MTPRAAVPPIPAPFSSYEPDPCPECSSPAILRNGDARKFNACGAHYEENEHESGWTDALAASIGRAILDLAAICEASGEAWGLYRSHATLPGREGEFHVLVRHGPGRGETKPATGATIAAALRMAIEKAAERRSAPLRVPP